MEVRFTPAPWHKAEPSETLRSVNPRLLGLWSATADEFYADVVACRNLRRSEPKGMQKALNEGIATRMGSDDWIGSEGRFVKAQTWVRFTFRHQMSLGSDFLDALRVHRLEALEECAIVTAPRSMLQVISPGDANVLCSYEKLTVLCQQLVGALDIPLFLGRLEARSEVPRDVLSVLRAPRGRKGGSAESPTI